MTKPDKLSIAEVEEIICSYKRGDGYSPCIAQIEQLADVMRQRDALREALDTIAEATRFLKGDVTIYTIAKEALKPYKDSDDDDMPQNVRKLTDKEIRSGFASKVYNDPSKQSESRDFSALHSTPEKQVTYTGELKPENVTMTVAQTKTSV